MVLRGFMRANNIADVGGLYPSIEIDEEGIEFSGYGHQIPGGPTVGLLWRGEDTGRWIQRNDTTDQGDPPCSVLGSSLGPLSTMTFSTTSTRL
jgi:hypothetical protein